MNNLRLSKLAYAFTLSLAFVCTMLLTCTQEARAQDEARPVWQVTRFDVTATLPAQSATDRSLAGRAVLSARNVGTGAGRSLTLRINSAAEIKSATVGDATVQYFARDEARTGLKQVSLALTSPVPPGSSINAALDYRLPIASNTGLAAISPEGAQFLPLSGWYPTPNSQYATRGADTAPVRLTVNAPGGDTVLSSGTAAGATYEQKLSSQPFFLTGKWDTIEGANDARGISAYLPRGATADERKRAEALVALAASARNFYTGLFGALPETPIRLVSVTRGAGFDVGGTILLDTAVFRRAKVDALTAQLVGEAFARLWFGGATPVRGEGSGVVREGLARYLATLFLEKEFGREAADGERQRQRIAYTAVARRDAPLSITTPLEPTYYLSVANKGAMIWRLADRSLGREAFLTLLREQLQKNREGELTLAILRAAFNAAGGATLKTALDAGLDQPTEIDLLIGLPQQRAGEWVSALRNTGAIETNVSAVAVTDTGERVTAQAVIPPRDFADVRFKTPARIVRVEVDPDKLYPQLDYANDTAPRAAALEDSLEDATRLLAAGQHAQSETIAREMLTRAPIMQEARILLARALLEQNKLPDAEREFRAALDERLPLAATLAWANIGLGEISLRRNQAAEAARYFTEAVRAEGGYPPTLAARAARLKAEAATGTSAPAIDESVRAFVTQFDQTVRSGRKVELESLIMSGELGAFAKGIVGSQPEQWQTKLLRTEALGSDRFAADVQITAKTLGGREQSGTAVLVFARSGNALRLVDVPIFEVR
ncbi:MAG TPA: tetratricopeptide repeat protein [Pyrinomonadaceae bacterium]|nr:tetratricopeptide repeat protein [Pyrinomonadaceae bacterium]